MQEISFHNNILPLKDKLFRLALRITLHRAEAEDIIQEAMIRVWNRREEWPRLESIEAYCITIVRNLAIDRVQLKESGNQSLTPEMEDLQWVPGPLDGLVRKEQLELIHQLISELPEKQKMVMQLRDIEGEGYKEIARSLQLTEEQVKVNLFRARQKVKQRFTEIEKYGL
ncbi:MAG: sigma-70 family RNA polymerase sigma factor [Bacteroides sp.]|nr:sigma-70 family RNA polymerase sigma factor [Bacteroides sp.]